MARFLPQINEVVRSDEMLAQRWLPQWEKLAERSWASALEAAVEGEGLRDRDRALRARGARRVFPEGAE